MLEESEAIQAYLDAITKDVAASLGSSLIGLYVHGSAVQGDFRPETSDIDILGVVSEHLDEAQRAKLTSLLVHEARPVPTAAGLEFILCPVEAAGEPILAFPFEYALSTGANWPKLYEPPGTASDILIDIALCRQAGHILTGPPPDRIFGPVPHSLLCQALIDEIQWHRKALLKGRKDVSGENAVLNAARSLHAAKTGEIVSKTEGGRLWLERYPSDSLIAEALERRQGTRTTPLDQDPVIDFLGKAENLIRSSMD